MKGRYLGGNEESEGGEWERRGFKKVEEAGRRGNSLLLSILTPFGGRLDGSTPIRTHPKTNCYSH